MVIVDANVLLYTVNEDSPFHRRSVRWVEAALSGTETVGFAWLVILAFLRLSTRAPIMPSPLDFGTAIQLVERWLERPQAVVVGPGSIHLRHLRRLLGAAGPAGNLVQDAHLAALAVERQATVVSFDRDFGRFPGVSWREPD